MRWDELDELLAAQDGVVSRRQVLSFSGTDNDIERLIRRRDWARVFEGVYIHHTGPPTWRQRGWSAVLLHHPAVLDGQSALRAEGIDVGHESAPIEVAVASHRRVCDPPGVVTRQVTRFAEVALFNLGPPRVRIEQAALTVARVRPPRMRRSRCSGRSVNGAVRRRHGCSRPRKAAPACGTGGCCSPC